MATLYWLGTADAVAQSSTVQITGDDAATTYTITIGGHAVSVAGSGTGVNDTAAALETALLASTDPYFAAVTWAAVTDTITGTADTPGAPFVATSSVNGGAGTIGAVATPTASAGPNHWDTAANWSTGSVPVAADSVIIENNSINICWGLAQSAVDLASYDQRKTYTGKIGLNRGVFATSADAETTDATEVEYRDDYLAIESTLFDFGAHTGPSTPAGSARTKIDMNVHATTVTVHSTAANPSETGLSALRLLMNNAANIVYVRSAPGGVGIAVDAPDETSTLARVSISDISTATKVTLSAGVTITTYDQTGGTNQLNAAANITTVTIDGGVITSDGAYTVTTGTLNAGTWNANHTGTGFTTLNLAGGIMDARGSSVARTWSTVNMSVGATLRASPVVTITTLNEPTDPYTLAAT